MAACGARAVPQDDRTPAAGTAGACGLIGQARNRYNSRLHAAVAQLVERNLAKVEVESSRLFCRSRHPTGGGHASPRFLSGARRGASYLQYFTKASGLAKAWSIQSMRCLRNRFTQATSSS